MSNVQAELFKTSYAMQTLNTVPRHTWFFCARHTEHHIITIVVYVQTSFNYELSFAEYNDKHYLLFIVDTIARLVARKRFCVMRTMHVAEDADFGFRWLEN